MENIITKEVIWFIIGMVFFLIELAVPGIILLFFGIGAWITALCCLFFDISLNVQLITFLLSSTISLLTLRRFLRRKYMNVKNDGSADLESEYIGKTAIALEDFNAEKTGKVSFKGSTWEAIATREISKGQNLVITGFESIKLFVEPANK